MMSFHIGSRPVKSKGAVPSPLGERARVRGCGAEGSRFERQAPCNTTRSAEPSIAPDHHPLIVSYACYCDESLATAKKEKSMNFAYSVVAIICSFVFGSSAARAENEWIKSKPVWEQTEQLVCKATRQGTCLSFLEQCRVESGKSMWKFNFSANELVYYGIDFKERLVSKHFRSEFQHMNVQLESGRLMTFRYDDDKTLHTVKVIGVLLGETYGNVAATQWDCFKP